MFRLFKLRVSSRKLRLQVSQHKLVQLVNHKLVRCR
jgi:hypothetical protein